MGQMTSSFALAAAALTAGGLVACAETAGPSAGPSTTPTAPASSPTPSPTPTPSPQGVPLELAGTWASISASGPHQLLPDQKVRVSLDAGRFALHPGCNGHGGDLQVDGDRLIVGRLVSTKMACAGPVMDQERWVSQLFVQPVTWAVVDGGDHLRLTQGEQTITFERVLDKAVPPTQ